MRKFQLNDIFIMSKIAKKLNLKDEIKNLQTGEYANLGEGLTGLSFFTYLFENLYLVEEEVLELIASLKEITVAEAQKIDIMDFFSEFKENEGMKVFLQSAGIGKFQKKK